MSGWLVGRLVGLVVGANVGSVEDRQQCWPWDWWLELVKVLLLGLVVGANVGGYEDSRKYWYWPLWLKVLLDGWADCHLGHWYAWLPEQSVDLQEDCCLGCHWAWFKRIYGLNGGWS